MNYPIIYLRGFALSKGLREETSNDPFQGFNDGSTRIRQRPNKSFKQHIFESPLIRLMKEYNYEDGYLHGELAEQPPLNPIYIHRYYEDSEGRPHNPEIPEAALGLDKLISDIRHRMVKTHDHVTSENFKVYLVAHSMGGLVVRCFLQNSNYHSEENVKAVDKVFTYGTPHGGITFFDGVNVPEFLGVANFNNFNRKIMADYLDVPSKNHVQSLNGKFDPKRFFCFVGTNNKDYTVPTKHVLNEPGDGLVTTRNAWVEGAYRSYSFVSHSGPYGMVNSEAGYQSLVRFLFGDLYVEGRLELDEIPVPRKIRRALEKGQEIEGSYLFESSAHPNIYPPQPLFVRKTEHASAIIKSYDELMGINNTQTKHKPILFSMFLDTTKRQNRNSKKVKLGIEVKVVSTDFKIIDGGLLWWDKEVANQVWFVNDLNLQINSESLEGDRGITYKWAMDGFSDDRGSALESDEQGRFIPIKNKLGFKAKLRINVDRFK